jgi:phosphoribosylaminoimidazole-succinocarboxamide synthase
VRDVYDLGNELLLVATDRLSAFDVVLAEPIPDKGKILCGISEFWFRETEDLVPNHWISTSLADFPEPFASEPSLAGRAMLVHKAKRVDVECVVRGYLAGSAWAEYRRSGLVSGIPLPSGLHKGSRLPEPIFTPTTKADRGHDEPLSFGELERHVGAPLARRLRDVSLSLYERGHRVAKEKGFLVADTKFEFGHRKGELTVIDELLTPDSSRYWRAAQWREGDAPESWDKQVIRDYLESLSWNKEPPAPHLPPEIIHQARERYLDVYRAITGRDLPR